MTSASSTAPPASSASSATTTRAPDAPALDPAEICTLPADQLRDRVAWIRSEIMPYAIATIRLEQGIAYELTDEPGLADKIDRLIELERDCCAGIDFARVAGETQNSLRLEVRGIDPDVSLLGRPGETPPRQHAGRRLAKAASAGVLGSFILCCVVPILAGAVLGASAVAPLAALDAPAPIAVGALLGGGAVWWWLGRRGTSGTAAKPAADTDGCGGGC